jgi:hypothetical protein
VRGIEVVFPEDPIEPDAILNSALSFSRASARARSVATSPRDETKRRKIVALIRAQTVRRRAFRARIRA